MTGKRGRPPSGGDKIVSFAEFTAPLKYKWALEDLAGKTPKKKHLFFREALKNYIDDNNYEAILAQEQALADMHARNAQELSRKIGERDAEKNIAAEGKIRKLIMANADASVLTETARRHGMRNLREDGWHKVALGLTTAEEVMRVTQEF
jgi:predicted DNA-binding protein